MRGNDKSPRLIPVKAAHARALGSHFKTVEEYLRVVESWLDGVQGVFYSAEAELSQDRRDRVRTLIGEVLEGLGRIRQELGLQPEEVSSLGVMRAYLSELWVSLVETRGRYLRGYGEVAPELEHYLDDRIAGLESRVNEIRRLVEGPPRTPKADPTPGGDRAAAPSGLGPQVTPSSAGKSSGSR
ncbi:MAG TPA: hypothetical protein VI455_16835 [Terriglobia bacterium]